MDAARCRRVFWKRVAQRFVTDFYISLFIPSFSALHLYCDYFQLFSRCVYCSSSSITFLIFVTFRKRKEEKNWKSGIGPEFLLSVFAWQSLLNVECGSEWWLWKVSGRILLFNGKWSRRPEQHFEITHSTLHQRFCRKVDSCRGRNSFLRNAHTICDSSSKMWVTKPREIRNTTSTAFECALGAVLRDFRSCYRDLSLIEGNLVPDWAEQKVRVRRVTWRCINNNISTESNQAEIRRTRTGGRRQEKKDAARSFVG